MNITVVVWTTVMFVLFPACSGDNKNLAEAITERDSLPTMKTLGVTTLISDSGITRYKIITEEWEIYDKKNPPYWAFEKGVYLEKFDSLFHIDASIKADTAYYYEKKKLWELRSNVQPVIQVPYPDGVGRQAGMCIHCYRTLHPSGGTEREGLHCCRG